jgi:hypothetical protein
MGKNCAQPSMKQVQNTTDYRGVGAVVVGVRGREGK